MEALVQSAWNDPLPISIALGRFLRLWLTGYRSFSSKIHPQFPTAKVYKAWRVCKVMVLLHMIRQIKDTNVHFLPTNLRLTDFISSKQVCKMLTYSQLFVTLAELDSHNYQCAVNCQLIAIIFCLLSFFLSLVTLTFPVIPFIPGAVNLLI